MIRWISGLVFLTSVVSLASERVLMHCEDDPATSNSTLIELVEVSVGKDTHREIRQETANGGHEILFSDKGIKDNNVVVLEPAHPEDSLTYSRYYISHGEDSFRLAIQPTRNIEVNKLDEAKVAYQVVASGTGKLKNKAAAVSEALNNLQPSNAPKTCVFNAAIRLGVDAAKRGDEVIGGKESSPSPTSGAH